MELININEKRESVLLPLIKWRILAVTELLELSEYNGNLRNMHKLVSRLEKDNLLTSFIHKYNDRKYVHLTRVAHKEISDQPWNISTEIKMHDAIVSTVLYNFSKQEFVNSTTINYQNISFNQSIFSHGVDPDGMICANRKGRSCNIAIEIELTRKSSSEILKKFKKYNENTEFDFVIYFFKCKRTLNTYFKYYEKFCKLVGIAYRDSQVLFCYSTILASTRFQALDTYWKKPDASEGTLKDLFL